MRVASSLSLAGALLVGGTPAVAQINARMFRYPDVSATHITFVYAGDIWVVPKLGGTAQRLSSPRGEEQFPRFSLDGSRIAFSANYDGNMDVYVIPTMGGEPVRVTHHPMGDRILNWYPDGRSLLIASSRESGRQRFNQLYRVAAGGGLPTKLPVPYGEFGMVSHDGTTLAYIPISRDFRTWKRYRGGMNPDIWLFNLRDSSATNITQHDADDTQPMWHGNTLYFLSDRGANERHNIWAYDRASGETRQVTSVEDYDITFPSIGPNDIVYQAGGHLYLLDLATEQSHEVAIDVVTDRATLKPRMESVAGLIQAGGISPTGQRVVMQARGDVFTVPAEHGPVLNLTRTSSHAERYPRWSPDGRSIAYWSDASGEYELVIRAADGTGEPRTVTSLGEGYRYAPHWSPDAKRIAFVDEDMRVRVLEVESRRVRVIDESPIWMGNGALQNMSLNWSSDSRWLVFSRAVASGNGAVFLFDAEQGELHQATSGYYNDFGPVFDPDGKYLYFYTNRTFQPVYGDFDNGWTYPNATNIAAVTLRPDVPSPLAPRNDVETVADNVGDDDKAKTADSAVVIALEQFEQRLVLLPPEAGNYAELAAVSGKVVFRRQPRSGTGGGDSPIVSYDLAEREEKTIMDDADGFEISHDGKKMLVVNGRRFAIVDVKPGQKIETPLRTAEMRVMVNPQAEWRQLFNDAWRFQRDFFYDPNMHGVDWREMRERYGRLMEDAVTRWDVNFVIGELIAELNASHTYRGGGDEESAENRGVGLLGVDWSLENGAFRIRHVVDGAPWDAEARSPLQEPGVNVREGEYVLAVNGVPMDTAKDPWAAFENLDGKPVMLTVNSRPSLDGARQVLVEPTRSETRLRHLEWIEANRRRVEEATDGRVGYIYVRSTGVDAQNELVRQFMAQFTKDALIIDERFNSGGQIPDRFIELLNRPMLSYWAVRAGKDWQWPPVAHRGPKVMLTNGWSGSGGDAFPYYFREAGIGPLIGTRTWGGLIGISGAPPLIDGGSVTVPTFRMFGTDGEWFAEGEGVHPDILVPEDPSQLARGIDTQLERAIQETLRMLQENPPIPPKRPDYENRTPKPKRRT